MFGTQFYPTPKELAKYCIDCLGNSCQQRNITVLDPSAGSGAFLDVFVEMYTEDAFSYQVDKKVAEAKAMCFGIEIDADLSSVLHGKGYNVIDADFLKHQSHRHYNIVLMNPPFEAGAKHLLYAWDNINFDKLVCILNAETLRNQFSFERKRLGALITEQGFSVEYKEAAFADADRKTNVDIAIVVMTKKRNNNIFDDVNTDSANGIEFEGKGETISALSKPNVIRDMVDKYNATIQEYIAFRRAANRMKTMEGLWDWDYEDGRRASDKAAAITNGYMSDDQSALDDFVRRLNYAAWSTVFKRTEAMNNITSEAKKDFQKKINEVGNMAFTERNIYMILEALMQNRGDIMHKCVCDVFDYFTRYHDENKCHFEGWKTNDAFEVKRKVILPYLVENNFFSGRISVRYNAWDKCDDIDKAMCYLSGKQFSGVNTIRKAVDESQKDNLMKFESEFFHIRVFKKGTIHLEFKDEALYLTFNKVAAQGKNWLKAWQSKYAKKQSIVLF